MKSPHKILSAALAALMLILLPAAASAQIDRPMLDAAASQKISLDLKGVDIVDVLKLLSEKGKLNFVAGRNVSGRVTIFAENVDVWNAFELIVDANDLAYEIKGDLINVMTERDYEVTYGTRFQEPAERAVIVLAHAKVVQVATVLNQIKSAVGRVIADEPTNTLVLIDTKERMDHMREVIKELDRPVKTAVYHLAYANGEDLREQILEQLTPVGTYTFDERTNKVVISDLPEIIAKVDRVIRAFDTPDPQVSIDASILQVSLNEGYNLGIDWQQVFAGIDTQTRTNFRVMSDVIGGTATGAALRLMTAPDNTTTLIVEALKTIGHTETLSNPKIVVANKQEAKILVGTKEAVVSVSTTVPSTGTVVTSPEIQYVDVGTKLFVTPNIKPDGHVEMLIKPEVSTATIETFADNRIPIVTTTEAETTVLVRSGSTLIIGGLIETTDSKTVNKLPLLGDIPIVGRAFQGVTDTQDRSELVVFLTPQIIYPDGSKPLPEPEMDFDYEDITVDRPLSLQYRALIRQQIQNEVYADLRKQGMPAGTARLTFQLDNQGGLRKVERVESPQGELFESIVKRALEKAAPFPPFPQGSPAREVRFNMELDYSPFSSESGEGL